MVALPSPMMVAVIPVDLHANGWRVRPRSRDDPRYMPVVNSMDVNKLDIRPAGGATRCRCLFVLTHFLNGYTSQVQQNGEIYEQRYARWYPADIRGKKLGIVKKNGNPYDIHARC